MQIALACQPTLDETLRVDINISATLGISAVQAKRKLARYFMDNVSMFIGPEEPILLFADKNQIYWRFPVSICIGRLGKLGQLGTVDVDARNGEILLTESYLAEIKNTIFPCHSFVATRL